MNSSFSHYNKLESYLKLSYSYRLSNSKMYFNLNCQMNMIENNNLCQAHRQRLESAEAHITEIKAKFCFHCI